MEEFEVIVVDFSGIGSKQAIKSKLSYEDAVNLANSLNQTIPRPYKYIVKKQEDD